MAKRIVAVIFEGGRPNHRVTETLAGLRGAVVVDTISKLQSVVGIAEIVLSTNYPELADKARAGGAKVHEQSGEFHFGRTLQNLVRSTGADGVICLGGAAAPYLTVAEFQDIVTRLESSGDIVVTNNPQSADVIGFTPAEVLLKIEPPAEDNNLATALREQGGLIRQLLPHSLGVHFDLDTPTDALLMALLPDNGPAVKAVLAELPWKTAHLRAAVERIRYTHCELGLIGRVSPQVMTQINSRTFARLRVFSEERGMKALGRIEKGQVVSLIGHFIEAVGIDAFFSYLSEVCDVCFIDTRVLFAHLKLQLTEADRFLSDLGLHQKIGDPWLRDFTQAAAECNIPIILGGHSLVSGGIWAILHLLDNLEALGTVPFASESPGANS